MAVPAHLPQLHYLLYRIHTSHCSTALLYCIAAPQEDTFKTCSGRDVALRIFTRAHDTGRVDFAMQSLKRSMKCVACL
jgi:aminopeptidase N